MTARTLVQRPAEMDRFLPGRLANEPLSSPRGDQGIPTPIYAGTTKIGQVEIRHSRECATVWSRVKNLTSQTLQSRETILIYSDANGNGEQAFEETDTLAPSQTGWSKQYRDRASFAARGSLFHNGAWRTAQTARSVAWSPYLRDFPDIPYGCQHTASWPCLRWPKNANGTRATFHHVLGLGHVWDHGNDGIDNVGSKATCVGKGTATGPSIDDVSAQSAVYAGALP